MATSMKRMTVSFPAEWESEIAKLKKERFYDKPTSELIRYLIQKGLESDTHEAS